MGFLLTSQLGNGPLGSYTDLSSLTGLEGHLKMLECHLQAQELQPFAYHLFTLLLVSECNHGQDLSAYDCTSVIDIVPFSLVNEGSGVTPAYVCQRNTSKQDKRPKRNPIWKHELEVNQKKILLGFSSEDSSQENPADPLL